MKRTKSPRRWEQPGFRFYTPALQRWLGGYQPVLADELISKRSTVEQSRTSSRNRDAAMKKGSDWAHGTIPGLSKNADQMNAQLRKTGRILKSGGLG